MTALRVIAALSIVAAAVASARAGALRSADLGRLRVTVVDQAAGFVPTPARVELLSADGTSRVPAGAAPFPSDCDEPPARSWRTAARSLPQGHVAAIADPASGATQFYVDGGFELSLPAGEHHLTVRKGNEYRVHRQTVPIVAGDVTHVEVALVRWANLANDGWYSADDHLHIPRPDDVAAARIARWMQAEDLHVANLLQMGTFRGVRGARQDAAFGAAGAFRDGETIVASGQENPRAWVLGHGILLGASDYIDFPDTYLAFGPYWRAARDQGALRGYAHFGGVPFLRDALLGSIDFLEILQFDGVKYADLYRALNLGLRITPTAGTDFPCGLSSPPGRERFYARVDGPLGYASWLDAVARGHTFVSNGPLLSFRIGSAEMGDTIQLPAAAELVVEASVRFDPAEDDVTALEIVRDGEVVHRAEPEPMDAEIRTTFPLVVDASGWVAVRAEGTKIGALPIGLGGRRTASAHGAPIYLRVGGETDASSPETRAEVLALLRESRLEIQSLVIGEDAELALQADEATLDRDRAAIVREFREAEKLLLRDDVAERPE
jgi:hypothetical protein